MSDHLLQFKSLMEGYLRETPVELSASAFVNVFAWQEFFKFDFQEIDGTLCIFAVHDMGTFLYLPPLGRNVGPATIQTCFARMYERNRGKGVSRIENVDRHHLPFFAEEKFSIYCKGYEYVYYRKDLVDLAGNAYKSKRHAYNHFVENNKFTYEVFSADMQPSCVELYESWAEQRKRKHSDPIAVHMLEENRSVHRLTIENAKELGLLGRVVFVDGKMRAYSFGYALNEHTFCVLFEVADLNINGLPVYLFSKFCADPELEQFKFINVMDDFALDHIKQIKLSFRPTLMFPSYTVSLRE